VLVDVYVRRDVHLVASKLRRLGMKVTATSNRGAFRIVEGRLPVGALRRAAALGRVRGLVEVPPPVLSVGGVTSEGDSAHNGPQARAQGPTGQGVDVGIISDSINKVGGGVAASQASGDLPPSVTVLSDQASGGTDEGRAMAEIVYDEAPGISRILFGSAFSPPAPVAKAQMIDSLVAAGADVIADDTAFFSEPFFQDGVVAQAVDRARASGVVYFAAAGNQARQSWQGSFDPSGVAGPNPGEEFHDFDPAAGTDTIQSVVNVPNDGTLTVFMQWDEPFGQVQTDIDVYLTNAAGTQLGQAGTTDNLTTGIPVDGATFKNTGASVPVSVRIVRAQGTRAPFMKYIVNQDFASSFTIAEHATNSDAIAPDAASARGSVTVAAVRANEPGLNDPEVFSSRGPKSILFDTAGTRLAAPEVRQKPQIAAADGVSTTVPGFGTFFGTSAAAPAAAGVAALLRSRDPTLTPAAVETAMTAGQATNDCTLAGDPDVDCGFGFVFADGALSLVPDPTPPVISPSVNPPAPNGANGFHTTGVGVTWSVSDPGSKVTTATGCSPSSIATDTAGVTLTCSATSGGGSASQSVTVKRDASPPAPPTFTGITARTFERAFVPAAAAVGCTSADPTSGATCTVAGYDAGLGTHTLFATARNGAGLTSTGTLTYTVIRTRPAISRLTAARLVSLRGFLRSGVLARVTVARPGTRLTAVLTGPGGIRVARVVRTAGAGRASLRLRAARRGRALLRGRRRTPLKLALSSRPKVGLPLTLRRSVVVRR
jgi:subtilisin family serine protease